MSLNHKIYPLLITFSLLNLIKTADKKLVNDLFSGLYKKEIYSGYLKTDVVDTELFYIFTPSQSSPKKDPIILWLNGGPGCSSTEGFLEEIGPVKFKPYQSNPVINEYSWNKNANLIFIESPGGVGYSKVKNPNCFYNDEIQAVSLNIAIQNFFKIFPEYKENNFFISGESYAGTYIPYLVKEMFKYMDTNPNAIKINLKGFLIGNPYTYENVDFEDSIFEFSFSHALISMEIFDKYLKECPHWPQKENIYSFYQEKDDYKYDPIIIEGDLFPWKKVTKACNEVRNETKNILKGINYYGIYKECPNEEKMNLLKKEFNNINYDEINKNSKYNHFKMMIYKRNKEKYYNYLLKNENSFKDNTEYENAIDFFPSCGENHFTEDFLNNVKIKEKLGVSRSIKHQQCYLDINYKMGDSINFYKNDLKKLSSQKNFSAWLFSGTEDMAVTTLGTLRFLNELNFPIKEKWKKWKYDGQVVGMEQSYDNNLHFITIKGSGHMVPEDNPKVAKALLDKFLEYHGVDINTQPEPENNKNTFPVWALILMCLSVIIIILIVLILARIKKKKIKLNDEIDDLGDLLSKSTI